MKCTAVMAVTLFGCGGLLQAQEPATAFPEAAALVRLVEQTSVPTGLVVLVGENDLRPAEALARTGRYLVHQLVPAERVVELRRAALEAGVSGRVVVDALPADGRLPHSDRFADVIMAADTAEAEVHRVLNVGGRAILHREGRWQIVARKGEEGIDDWTHKWHGPSGQVLSLDRKAGPPTTVQWAAGPALADGSVPGKHPVIGSGVFAAVDNVDGAVQVRSAGSGLPRWRGDFGLPVLAELLIDGDRLVCRRPPTKGAVKGLAEGGTLTAFDLLSGKEALAYGEAPNVPAQAGKVRTSYPVTLALGQRLLSAAGSELVLLDRVSGKRAWTRTLEKGEWFSPVVLDDVVVVGESAPDRPSNRARIDIGPGVVAIAAFALADGKPRWRVETDAKAPPMVPLVAAEGKVFLHTASYQSRQPGAYIAALDVNTGKQLWRHELPDGTKDTWSSTDSASRLICRDGTLYYVGGHSRGGVVAFDAKTGKVLHDYQKRPRFVAYGGECSGSLATVNWLIMSGVTWWGRDLKAVNQPAARSSCGTGVFPAQGMVFANPTGCDCTQYARGYLGLNCSPLPEPVPDAQRLVRGPAQPPADAKEDPDGWPTFLATAQRTGTVKPALPATLAVKWKTSAAPAPIGGPLLDDQRRDEYWQGPLTAPVSVHGRVVVGLPDAQAVAALDAASGKVLWRVALGGPVDTPPTIHKGLCLVGCQDGHVHALRLDDGRPVWRFLAAPSERKAILQGRLASAFPAPGSVLVLGDTLLATAGYHSYLGGLHVWALDPRTGEVRGRSTVTGGEPPTQANMVLGDVLSAGREGKDAWIFRHFRLGLDGKQLDVPKRESGTHFPGDVATDVIMDRRAAVVRFGHNQRGGSTHGWKAKMTSGPVSAFRVVRDGPMAYALDDPTDEARQHNTQVILQAQRAEAVRYDQKSEPVWTKRSADLGKKESYTALIKAGDRLYLGGGNRDGSKGFVQVVAAADGKLLQEVELPAQVSPCGLAAAGGRLFVSCLDGSLVCLAE